jgi:hypothetical protein
MRLANVIAVTTLIACSAVIGGHANAQFGGLPSLGSIAKSSTSVDVDGLLKQQSGLLGRFNSAFYNMLSAQAKTLAALNLQADSDRALKTAENYKSGNVIDEDQIKRDTAITKDAQAKIDEAMKNSTVVSSTAKKNLAGAVPHYAKGIADTATLPSEINNWASSVQSGITSLSSNPMQALKLKDGVAPGLFVAENLPELVSTWSSATKNFVSFAQGNDIDVKDVESKLGDL